MILSAAALALAFAPVDLPAADHTRPDQVATSTVARAARPPRGWDAFATCVLRRESHGNPRAGNASSGAAGLVQFLPAWRHGLPFMVADRLVHFGMPRPLARTIRLTLPTRIERWPARLQLVGFAEVLDRGGWAHWALAGSRCDGLAR